MTDTVRQTTDTIMMVRPGRFRMNEQTAADNYYQKATQGLSPANVQSKAMAEFDAFANKLAAHGIEVIVVDDIPHADTPDSVFPNNWISMHQDGRIVLYPMLAENRRRERREDITARLKADFKVSDVVDLSEMENVSLFLEGTGSMVLDRPHRLAYAALSVRTQLPALKVFCKKLGYRPVIFRAFQSVRSKRLPIYHTNVMMSVSEEFAVLCADSIDNEKERASVTAQLESTGKKVMLISEAQKHRFAGNVLQVRSRQGEPYLVMSSAAFKSLNQKQIGEIEKYCTILHSPLETIEALGGGSARCMIAEVFLPGKINH